MNYLKQVTKRDTVKSTNNPLLLLMVVGFTVFALWFPFGFALTALIEEWGFLGLFVQHGLFFVATPDSPLGAHALRPLTLFPHAIAYYLDTNSFFYLNISLILALVVKGCSVGYLIRKMTNSLPWALLAGGLIILYPADTMQIAFRGLHINWSLSLMLFAGCTFIMATDSKRWDAYFFYSILTGTLMLMAICLYDVALVLFGLPVLILYAKSGFKNTLRVLSSRKLLVVMWLSALGLYLLYVHYVSTRIASYEGSVVGKDNLLHLLALYYPKLFCIGALRGLLGGWFDAFRILFSEYAFIGYLYLLLITIIFYALFLFSKPWLDTSEHRQQNSIRILFVGFLLLLFGYLPFALLISHSAISQRTFLFASPGAVIVWISILMWIANWAKKTALAIAFILIFTGLAAQLFQFHHYIKIATTQRYLLKNIVSNYDGNPDKTLVIVDKSNQLNHTWMFITQNLNSALTYIYNHPIKPVQICHAPGKGWQLSDTISRPGTCIEHEDSWSFRYPPVIPWGNGLSPHRPEQVLTKKDVFALTINPDGSVHADPQLAQYRYSLFHSKNALSARFHGILSDNNWPSYFKSFWVEPLDRYEWKFGKWWSLEIPTRGNGWRESEWEVHSFFHESSAWKTQKKATLQFDLMPQGTLYQLHGHLKSILNNSIRDSIKLSINNHRILFHWLNSEEFEATIPVANLVRGVNTLAFDSQIDLQTYGLSFRLISINLTPVRSKRTS